MNAEVKIEGFDELQRKLTRLATFCHKSDEAAKEIHKRHARNLAKKMRRRIKPAAKDIVVSGKDRSPLVVKKGTYKRSIAQWKPKKANVDHVYFVGPRTGRKVAENRDAWFQLIVEQDKQFIKGNNRHAFVITNLLKEETPKLAAALVNDYKKHLKRLAK